MVSADEADGRARREAVAVGCEANGGDGEEQRAPCVMISHVTCSPGLVGRRQLGTFPRASGISADVDLARSHGAGTTFSDPDAIMQMVLNVCSTVHLTPSVNTFSDI